MSFLGHDGKAALKRAITNFEANTAAELVITVEPRAGHYLHVPVLFGSVAGLSTLAFLLYGGPTFALHWFLIDPLAIAAIVGYVSSGWPRLERALTPRLRRHAWVVRAARAAFVARDIADTRGRTGILLYVAAAEREALVLADLAVRTAIPQILWQQACAPILASVASGAPARALEPHIAVLAELCSEYLPRQDDDVNELSDEVDA